MNNNNTFDMNTLQNNTNLEIEHYLKSALQRFKKKKLYRSLY